MSVTHSRRHSARKQIKYGIKTVFLEMYCSEIFIYSFFKLTAFGVAVFWQDFILDIEVGTAVQIAWSERGISFWHLKPFVLLCLIVEEFYQRVKFYYFSWIWRFLFHGFLLYLISSKNSWTFFVNPLFCLTRVEEFYLQLDQLLLN